MENSEQHLFGGAITIDLPKQDWLDVSDIRPVPDNQECFQCRSSGANPTMLVIEILERQEQVDDQEAAAFFFKDLAGINDALQAQSDIRFHTLQEHASPIALLDDNSIKTGKNTVRLCAGYGIQKVALGRDFDNAGNSRRTKQEIKFIRVDLYVLRLPVQETDLLLTLSTPLDSTNLDAEPLESTQAACPVLNRVVSTIRIRDWGLFG